MRDTFSNQNSNSYHKKTEILLYRYLGPLQAPVVQSILSSTLNPKPWNRPSSPWTFPLSLGLRVYFNPKKPYCARAPYDDFLMRPKALPS